ncbi:hypothetical protein [Pajaroellobacter abortibovis]|uniref:hypothetical protein n=1 Tax=Pajaroellobacter abortibovis TaxID=1882918 RepID=UPI0012EC0EA3|nr:hypothetical protein [Pajaroellobacter abortibovis]
MCWGYNDEYGHQTEVPVYRLVSVGEYQTCAIKVGGGVSWWGYGHMGLPEGLYRAVSVGSGRAC